MEKNALNDKPIRQIKKIQSKSINFVFSAIILACGINFIIAGIVDYLSNSRGWIFIIIGAVLVGLTALAFFVAEFLRLTNKQIIECVVTYDEEKREIVKIPGYSFSEDIKTYLEAACNESSDIKSIWNQDHPKLKCVVNGNKGNSLVALSQSAILLNQIIEYSLLKSLSLITSDYFNGINLERKKIKKISKIDVPDFVASNMFLNLFSKDTRERAAFNNYDAPNVIKAYATNGALFERFELNLPQKCQIHKVRSNIIELKHPLFKLRLTPAFTGFVKVLPHNFEKHYLHSSIYKIHSYKALIGVELKLSFRALFIRNSEYFEWIDKYIEYLVKRNSFQFFIEKIHWDIVEAIVECNTEEQQK